MELTRFHSLAGALMPTLSLTQLLDWLAQNQFLGANQADAMRPLLVSFPDTLALARELLRRDWLTAYQVNQIMQGKHEPLVLDDYRLRERLGEGAMGQVYKAWSLKHGHVVAVKTLHKERVPSALTLQRFRREVEAASQLDHPNIAFVRDAGEADGKPYLVMEYIDGFNLSTRVKKDGPLPIHEAVEYARQAALGLQHAQERGVVHRDIKPSNLMVTTLRVHNEVHPIVKILDFGLARYESEGDEAQTRLTKLGSLLGTIDYVAPEQAHDARNADIRADIYSLGCTLYFILTGRPPFLGDTAIERVGQRVTGEPPWVRAERPEVPPPLEDVLRTMMARRPEDRYQTPNEVASVLAPFATPQAPGPAPGVVMALPVTPAEMLGIDVPMATPVGAAPSLATAFVAEPPPTAPSLDVPTSSSPRMRRPKQGFPIVTAILGGIAVVFLASLCAGGCLTAYFWRGSPDDAPKAQPGSIEFVEAKLSVPGGILQPSDQKKVLVKFKRSGFKGPVKLSLHDLPDDVKSYPTSLKESAEEGEVPIDVSTWCKPPIERQIRVVLESEKEGVRAEMPLKIKIVEDRKKVGK